MRKIVLLMHVSLDGYVAGLHGEMDWVKLDDSLWDYVTGITNAADTALYGANTYKLMEDYWPTAAQKPDASKHDIDHASWANKSKKLVFSKKLEKTNWKNSEIIRENIQLRMHDLKNQPGKNLLMIGSTSLAQSFMNWGLIDEFRLNVNPAILGSGKQLFENLNQSIELELKGSKTFESGVVGLHYSKV